MNTIQSVYRRNDWQIRSRNTCRLLRTSLTCGVSVTKMPLYLRDQVQNAGQFSQCLNICRQLSSRGLAIVFGWLDCDCVAAFVDFLRWLVRPWRMYSGYQTHHHPHPHQHWQCNLLNGLVSWALTIMISCINAINGCNWLVSWESVCVLIIETTGGYCTDDVNSTAPCGLAQFFEVILTAK